MNVWMNEQQIRYALCTINDIILNGTSLIKLKIQYQEQLLKVIKHYKLVRYSNELVNTLWH